MTNKKITVLTTLIWLTALMFLFVRVAPKLIVVQKNNIKQGKVTQNEWPLQWQINYVRNDS